MNEMNEVKKEEANKYSLGEALEGVAVAVRGIWNRKSQRKEPLAFTVEGFFFDGKTELSELVELLPKEKWVLPQQPKTFAEMALFLNSRFRFEGFEVVFSQYNGKQAVILRPYRVRNPVELQGEIEKENRRVRKLLEGLNSVRICLRELNNALELLNEEKNPLELDVFLKENRRVTEYTNYLKRLDSERGAYARLFIEEMNGKLKLSRVSAKGLKAPNIIEWNETARKQLFDAVLPEGYLHEFQG